MDLHRIVIVGGGAGGLQLATRLGRTLGRRGLAHITLIDRERRHFWKPHLHEIAAGSMDLDHHAISYMAQAHRHAFTDRIGEMTGLDRARRMVQLAPHLDELGQAVTPQREIPYDSLVIAVGSVTNDFGTPGAREHAIALESAADAERFHRRLVNACIRAQANPQACRPDQMQVVIIGAGATGVELAAELRHTGRYLARYGLDRMSKEIPLGIHLVEAGPRVLPALPERFSSAALARLQALNVQVHTDSRVAAVEARGVRLADGRCIAAELVVWAAGIKGPDFLTRLEGLAVNRLQQLVVSPTLQTLADENIFAIGDCAACPWADGPQAWVPPRAQAAHQQAGHLLKNLQRRLKGQVLLPWAYRDFGSLLSLGRSSTVGQLMGGRLLGGRLWLSGRLAWLTYRGLYQSHQLALHGPWHAGVTLLANALTRWTRPRIKLH